MSAMKIQIAKEAEFFSFGTNDLTQMTFGYSRDDVGKFLPIYLAKGILQADPFEVSLSIQEFYILIQKQNSESYFLYLRTFSHRD